MNIVLEVGTYLFLVLGIFFGGVLLGYSEGLFKRIKEYDKLLNEQRDVYERRLREWEEEGEHWKNL